MASQPRTPMAPAQPRSSGNSPLLWMQPPGGSGGGGERHPSLQLQQQQQSAAATPFQAMQAMQLEAGLVAQQRAMIRQQLQAQQVCASSGLVAAKPEAICGGSGSKHCNNFGRWKSLRLSRLSRHVCAGAVDQDDEVCVMLGKRCGSC